MPNDMERMRNEHTRDKNIAPPGNTPGITPAEAGEKTDAAKKADTKKPAGGDQGGGDNAKK